MRRIAVVGASLAGLRAAEALRARGFDGELTVVGAERHAPYNRPPLSKQFLAGTFDEAACAFKYDVDARWLLGVRATRLDLARRSVELDGSGELPFDGLIVATGSSARPWPGPLPEMEGFYLLRELDDALTLRAAVETAERAVILGAGFIGSEVAATLRGRGIDVSLVDIAPAPMRPLGEQLGRLCAEIHAEHGVDLHLATAVEEFEGDGHVRAVRLRDGTRLETEMVLIATGAAPNVGWLEGSGLRLGPAIVCDATLAAGGTENVFAAGDVAQWPHPLLDGELTRVEHWSNAAEQARAAAANLLEPPAERHPFASVPSFWSDQYDIKIQSVGFPERAEQVHVVEGSIEERKFVAACERGGRLIGAIAFSWPRRIPWYRRQVADRREVDDLVAELRAAA